MALTQPVSAAALDYSQRADEDLVAAAQAGESLTMEFLLNKYKNFVCFKARGYYLIGGGREDIIQEGTIGLYKAVRDFRVDKLSSFRAFAELCVTRQIITAIKTATRQKHIPLNQYVSLNKPIYDDDSVRTLLEAMPSNKVSALEDLVINQEASELSRDGTEPQSAHQVDRQRAAAREAQDQEEPGRDRAALERP